MGVCRRIGEFKTARVCRRADIDAARHFLGQRETKLFDDLADNLRAGRIGAEHEVFHTESGIRTVVVDDQINAVIILLYRRIQHIRRGTVHRDHLLRLPSRRRIESVDEIGIPPCDLRIFCDICRLSQRTQGVAQRARRAGGVSVRTAVGQDQDIVHLPQGLCGMCCTANHSFPSRSRSLSSWLMCAP